MNREFFSIVEYTGYNFYSELLTPLPLNPECRCLTLCTLSPMLKDRLHRQADGVWA
jgi:hypothetical protein